MAKRKIDPPKFVKGKTPDDDTWEFMNDAATIDYEEGTVQFCYNICPDESWEYETTDIDEYLKLITQEINQYQGMKDMINFFGKDTVTMDADFYRSEGDCNIFITVPINHPKLIK